MVVQVIMCINQNQEIDSFIEAVYKKYGYDFRNYSKASIRRRILHRFSKENFESIHAMEERVLKDIHLLERVLLDLSINTTEMFRDPGFYQAIRKIVIPILRTYPSVKIWHAGCSSGEEVYSMAILLKEENMYDKATIYATDFNQVILKKAKEGIFPIQVMKQNTSNYQKAGGLRSFSDYYIANDSAVIMNKFLKKNIVFAEHNLVIDQVFTEAHVVICRNVLIYFDKELQNRVFKIFHESLISKGILCLGSKETVRFSDFSDDFEDVVQKEKIYKKFRGY